MTIVAIVVALGAMGAIIICVGIVLFAFAERQRNRQFSQPLPDDLNSKVPVARRVDSTDFKSPPPRT